MNRIWQNALDSLSVKFEHHFEKGVEAIMRLAWPAIRKVQDKSVLDRAGIDLAAIEWGVLTVGVQCKTRIGSSKATVTELKRVMAEDFQKLHSSTLSPKRFFYVINAPGVTEAGWSVLQETFQTFLSTESLRSAILLRPEGLCTLVFDHTKQRAGLSLKYSAVHEHVRSLSGPFSSFLPLTKIPMIEERIYSSDRIPRIGHAISVPLVYDILDFFAYSAESAVTLITGIYGSGKTTASELLATNVRGDCFVILRCREWAYRPHALNAQALIEWVTSTVATGSGISPTQHSSWEKELHNEAMRDVLQDPANHVTLIFDGIDEHRVLCTQKGFTELAEAAGQLGCNLVFTVRREFVDSELGRFDDPLRRLADQQKSLLIRKVELCAWGTLEILEFISRNIDHSGAHAAVSVDRKRRLSEFAEHVSNGTAERFVGDCLTSPLLLGFLVEDVAENGFRTLNSAEVMFGHVLRKLQRDRSIRSRATPGSESDIPAWLFRMTSGLVACATILTEKQWEMENPLHYRREELVSYETISLEHVVKIFKGMFPDDEVTVDGVRGFGLFITKADVFRKELRVYFTHKALQEFLHALHVWSLVMSYDPSPGVSPKIPFLAEIVAACSSARPSELASFVKWEVERIRRGGKP